MPSHTKLPTVSDWEVVLEVFRTARSRRGDKGRDDRSFLEALHHFTVHNITWRALPAEFGNWNSVWKRFWRLSRTGVFEAFFPKGLYRRRARIEQAIGKLKRFKRVALRCEKTAESYAAVVAFACSLILVKSVHTA